MYSGEKIERSNKREIEGGKVQRMQRYLGPVWFVLLGIVINLTINYGVKQSQFTKPTSEPPR